MLQSVGDCMLSIAPSSYHKLTKSLRKINGLLSLSRKAQLGSCRDSGRIGDSMTWSTEIHLSLLCDDVTSMKSASIILRYIEHLFSNRNLNAQL